MLRYPLQQQAVLSNGGEVIVDWSQIPRIKLPETIQAGTPQTLSALLHCRMSQQDTEYIASAKQASRVSKEQTAHLTAN